MSIFQRKNIKNIFSRVTFILLLINVYYIYTMYIYTLKEVKKCSNRTETLQIWSRYGVGIV